MSSNEQKAPSRLLRGVHRTLTGLHPALESLLAAVIGLLIGAVLMYVWGFNPWKAYWALFQGAYGGAYEWASTLSRAQVQAEARTAQTMPGELYDGMHKDARLPKATALTRAEVRMQARSARTRSDDYIGG